MNPPPSHRSVWWVVWGSLSAGLGILAVKVGTADQHALVIAALGVVTLALESFFFKLTDFPKGVFSGSALSPRQAIDLERGYSIQRRHLVRLYGFAFALKCVAGICSAVLLKTVGSTVVHFTVTWPFPGFAIIGYAAVLLSLPALAQMFQAYFEFTDTIRRMDLESTLADRSKASLERLRGSASVKTAK